MNKRIYTLLSILLFITNSYAIVVLSTERPNKTWVDKPSCEVVGRWNNNVSCVVIDPNHVDPVRTDLNSDYKVDMEDLKIFSSQWLKNDCGANNNYCKGMDFNKDGRVNLRDYTILVANWSD